jgi:protein-tyrosine phosphatase
MRIAQAGAADLLTVSSAGLAARDGRPMDQTIVQLLQRRGLGGTAIFRSRRVTLRLLSDAELLLTGTRDHRLGIGEICPEAYSRTFTLRECARLVRSMPTQFKKALPDRPPSRAQEVVRWLETERGVTPLPEGELDIADPVGRRPAVYRRMVDEVASAVNTIANVLLPVHPA